VHSLIYAVNKDKPYGSSLLIYANQGSERYNW